MLYVQKEEEPEFLRDFKRKNPTLTYESNEFKELREPLREILVKEQKYLCAYCCRGIDVGNSHVEHIEPQNPKGYVSKKTLDYDNIVASCNGFKGEKTCGEHKANDYDETKFVSPLDPKCEDVFTYYPNGEIKGDSYTIGLLNLDSYELNNARKTVYRQLQSLDNEMIKNYYLDENSDSMMPFTNVIKWYIKNHV